MMLTLLAVFVAGVLVGRLMGAPTVLRAQERERRVFELRTYTAMEGKHADLVARFRKHSVALLQKHGMTNIGYWVPQDEPAASNTLIYLLAFSSRSEAKERWTSFLADPAWHQVRQQSEADGKLVAKVESVYLEPTDFSMLA